ncbi:hypothetical protein IT570_14590 [Candidatus Sumerlaeota bacterium]|nr:hypothetical protein [Candidatus Sumerlaeota bacterium]
MGSRKKNAVTFPAVFFLSILAITHRGEAQTLRLDDLFSPDQPAAAEPKVSDLKQNPARAQELLDQGERKLNSGQFQDVLASTELLTAVLAQDSPEYGTALWQRARAYEGLQAKDKVLAVADLYLRNFPKGPNRGWFLLRIAREAQAQKKHNDAQVLWRLIATEKYPLSPQEALDGAELLTLTGDGATARVLLADNLTATTVSQLAPKDRERHDALMVESLLVLDDAKTAIPTGAETGEVNSGKSASAALRRALLLEIRGEKKKAQEEYAFLQQKSGLLTESERQLLEDRISTLSANAWPPPSSPTVAGQPQAPAAAPDSDKPILLSPRQK